MPNSSKAVAGGGSPESGDESAEDAEMGGEAGVSASGSSSFDGFAMHGIDAPYPAGQQPLPPAMPLDYGLGASIVSGDAFAYAPGAEFSFDAYGMGP